MDAGPISVRDRSAQHPLTQPAPSLTERRIPLAFGRFSF
jgi:hypothetical protein